ncbi:MAG: hypothetical protein K2X35_09715 [Bryobacteraceae bacterium]|nr:hypothetical protein [Bryobacteraceae bacterium]
MLIPAVAVTLTAQGPITDRLEVEFTQPVMVGDQRLEPGKYTIRQLPSQNNPRILEFSTNRGTKVQATAAAAPVMTNRNTKETSVILEQRGSDYHVRQVWVSGKNYGYEFLPIDGSAGELRVTTGTITAPRTIRLAATYTPGTQTTETTASQTTTETTERAAQTPAPTPQTPATEQQTAEQQRAEQERMAREQAEQERMAREQAERERGERERADQERVARERAEQERAEKERLAQQRAEQERLDRERAERERAEQERAAQQAAQREPARTAQRTTPAMPGTSSAFPSMAFGGLLIAGIGLLLHRFHGRM